MNKVDKLKRHTNIARMRLFAHAEEQIHSDKQCFTDLIDHLRYYTIEYIKQTNHCASSMYLDQLINTATNIGPAEIPYRYETYKHLLNDELTHHVLILDQRMQEIRKQMAKRTDGE